MLVFLHCSLNIRHCTRVKNPIDIPTQHNDYPLVTGTVIYHLILADISSAVYLVPDMPFTPEDKLEVEKPAAYIMSLFT